MAASVVAMMLLAFAPAASAHAKRAHGKLTVSARTARHSPTAFAAVDYNIPSTQQQETEAQKKAANKAAELDDKVGDAAIGLGAGILAYGALTGPGEAIAAPVGLGVIAFGAGLKVGGAIGKYLWGDPFADRRFRVIAKPLLVKIPTIGGSGANPVDVAATRYLTANLKLDELGQAYQTSINRALGAHAAHNAPWTVLQLAGAARYAKRGATLFLSLKKLREQFVAAIGALGFSTVTLPATTPAERAAALKAELSKLPKAVYMLFKRKPLRGHKLSELLGPAVASAPSGAIVLSSAFEFPGLDQAEEKLAGHLRTFAQIVKHLKRGHLPAGL